MSAKVYELLSRLVVSELCPRCEGPTETGYCAGCRADFAANRNPCRVCGLQIDAVGSESCSQHAGKWHTDRVEVPYLYCHPLDKQIYAMKFSGQRRIARALGQLLADSLPSAAMRVDALVPVPLHRSRLLERGFDQAFEMSRPVSQATRLPILRGNIERWLATPAQSTLRASSRQQNLRLAFRVKRELSGCRLAIIDDVITTGATINSLAVALTSAGASRVEAWALARTPRPHRQRL
jgi:ComF family protein